MPVAALEVKLLDESVLLESVLLESVLLESGLLELGTLEVAGHRAQAERDDGDPFQVAGFHNASWDSGVIEVNTKFMSFCSSCCDSLRTPFDFGCGTI
jgi:hypothetical protein